MPCLGFISELVQVHSIILADSGALLLLFTENSGIVQALRQKLSSALPGPTPANFYSKTLTLEKQQFVQAAAAES